MASEKVKDEPTEEELSFPKLANSSSLSSKQSQRPSVELAHTKNSSSYNETLKAPRCLNAYGLKPSTVPPFALDEEIKKLKLRNSQNVNSVLDDEFRKYCKDPFLVSHNEQWNAFIENVGSNVAYMTKGVNGNVTSNGTVYQDTATISSASLDKEKDNNGADSQSTDTETEREQVRKEVFENLDGAWEGDQRLKAVFNEPMLHNYNFTNQQDRSDWTDYLEQVKRFYYGNNESVGNMDRGNVEDENGKVTSFLDRQKAEFKKKKKRWRQLEKRKKQKWQPMLEKMLLDNQYVPLSFRIFIVILCVIALGLAIRIYQNSNSTIDALDVSVPQQASTIMAICVNSIAIFYLIFIAHDEFSGKPLGLRNPFGKLRLILLDLLFIIFSSANLALTFNTLYDKQWVCTSSGDQELPKIGYICRKQRALASFLFVVLSMWVLTFTISIVRVVEKVSSSSPR
ncbi:LAFE_0B03752g1_1 [Lachancea fermentati]|uniref:LAFE_0B03752g1_1 n=1 Tax=Lachancea fermentati TaxID=4955 RepID=A0A1G4M7R1_LACFM|nr:LAFE_0B03752g1_1 [Lachancea fermentati]